ncbi:hypothetical protein [Nonomuraea sediminis]|uniref:hypothetical protein n=1 Tax=Nonomuraea sediminis TaxID=2835864 RepID=UPI001BDBF123|nr:hypothetical protein [Nonomuraea sediminis]
MSDALEAFRRVSALAAEHRADLDAAARLMSAHAWVGGGAPHFAASLATQRGSVQSALAVALAALAREAVRQGDPEPGLPDLATPVVSTEETSRGVEAAAVAALVAALEAAAPRLSHVGTRVRGELAALSLPASPGWTISRAGEWAATQAPDLRRRLAKLRAAWIPADVVAFDLFGAYAAPGDPDVLLARVARGDAGSLEQLLGMRDAALPTRVNAWWRGLSSTIQQRLPAMPGFGALNGLPAAVRDQANRAVHPLELPVLLLGCSKRLVVAWGDPDTADVTLTYVPGADDLERARLLWERTRAVAGSRTVASIAWLGAGAVESDAQELAAFTDALAAVREPGRHVVLAQGPGCPVVARAVLLRPRKLADEVVFVGGSREDRSGHWVPHSVSLLDLGRIIMGDRQVPI